MREHSWKLCLDTVVNNINQFHSFSFDELLKLHPDTQLTAYLERHRYSGIGSNLSPLHFLFQTRAYSISKGKKHHNDSALTPLFYYAHTHTHTRTSTESNTTGRGLQKAKEPPASNVITELYTHIVHLQYSWTEGHPLGFMGFEKRVQPTRCSPYCSVLQKG